MLDFASYSVWVNAGVFVCAGAIVWWAGTRLTHVVDSIALRTGLGHAVAGMLLLGLVTSLPEVAVSMTAGVTGNAGLAVSNALGGVALQVVIICIGDALLRRHAITSYTPSPAVLLQAVFSCLLLCIVIAGVLAGDVRVLGVGLWTIGLVMGGILMMWLVSRNERARRLETELQALSASDARTHEDRSLRTLAALTLAMAAIILFAGYVLAMTGEAIANQTGLGENFVGATLVTGTTSLPEISTVVAAVRIKRYTMAFSDIFGTNMFDTMLVFVADAAYGGPPVLNEMGAFAAFAAALGIAVTLIYTAGLIERRDKIFMRLGIDSWVVLVVYAGGLVALYWLR